MSARESAAERDRSARRRLGATRGPQRHHCLAATARSNKPTPREIEVIGLIADGLLTEEIAAALVVSEWTIKSHVNHAKEKMGARTRAHLVKLSFQRGYLLMPAPEVWIVSE